MPNQNLRRAITALDNEPLSDGDPVAKDTVHLLWVLSEMEPDDARKAIRRALVPADVGQVAAGLSPLPATHDDLAEAVSALGYSWVNVDSDTVTLGLRAELDTTYAGLLDLLGVTEVLSRWNEFQLGREIAQEVRRRRHRDSQGQQPVVVGLAGLGNLDDEPLAPENGYWGDLDMDDEDEDDAWQPDPVDLVALVRTTTAAIAREAVELVLPALQAEGGMFAASAPVIVGDSSSVTLSCDGDQSTWLSELPPAQVVVEATVEVRGLTVPVAIRIAGDPDPDRPPVDHVAETNRVIARMADEGVIQARPERIMLELTRIDGRPFTEDQAREPLHKAVHNLATNLGPISVLDQMADVEPHVRLATLSLDGEGVLDPRALTQNLVRFTGTLPFEGIGMVRVRVRTGTS